MRYIYKIFHEADGSIFNDRFTNRLNFDSTTLFGLTIKPQNQPENYNLYYVPTNDMLKKVSNVHEIAREFNRTLESLPEVATSQFILECLVEELYNTNELEGIKSNKKEIARSAHDIQLNKVSKKRFESMIKSYMALSNDDIKLPNTSQDIRKIYDDITNGEIEEQELPDGDIFRKDTTYVLKKSGSGKVIHQGITPETKIMEKMGQLLTFMNDNDDIPLLIKVAVGHYYFGYIHPFYDGNGRTSRFFSSMYLSGLIGNISALSLSRGSNKQSKKYLEAFEVSNSIKNVGEMNYFIDTFLDILIETLIEMNAELKEKHQLLTIAGNKIANDSVLNDKGKKYKDVMFVLVQNHFFDFSDGITVRELSDIFDLSDVTIRKTLRDLFDLNLLEKTGERPAYYRVKQQYFEEG